MSNIKHGNDLDLAGFMTGWDKRLGENVQLPVGFAVIALTNFGERPVPSELLAEVLGRPVSEVEALAQAPCGSDCTSSAPVEDGFVRVEDGLITYINPDRAKSAPRRWLQIGHSRFGMIGCAFDVFLYAPLVRPSLQVEETCPATGTPIRIEFTPGGVETAGPASAVLPIPPPLDFDGLERTPPKEVDETVCAQCPFYSSAEAAVGWLAAHPGGRVFPVREAWDLSFHRIWRDRMAAQLNLGR